MRNRYLLLAGSVLLLGLGAAACGNASNPEVTAVAPRTNMRVTSPDFNNNQPIPVEYTCDGSKTHPNLTFTNLPENAQSLALVVDDPDAPSGTFVHWVVANVPPTTTSVPETDNLTSATQGKNGTGSTGWTAPCPPAGSGMHHYNFKLYALDVTLQFSSAPDAAALQTAMQGHILEQDQLTGTYQK